MPEETAKQPKEETIFGPGKAKTAETIQWGNKTAYHGETNEQWLSFEQGEEVQLEEWR